MTGQQTVFTALFVIFKSSFINFITWSEVKVIQSCPTLCDPMDYIVHGILQARILEWVAFPFSKGSSKPFSKGSSQSRDRTQVSRIAGRFFTRWATREALFCFCFLMDVIYIYIFDLNILYKNRFKSSQVLMTALSLDIILFLSLLPPIHAFLIYAQLLSQLWLFATPWTVAHQAPLSVKFSRQEYWSGLPFPSPGDLPYPGIKPVCLASLAPVGRFFTTETPGTPFLNIDKNTIRKKEMDWRHG